MYGDVLLGALAEAGDLLITHEIRDDRLGVDPRGHREVLPMGPEPQHAPVQEAPRRGWALEVEQRLVASPMVDAMEICPVEGTPTGTEGSEQAEGPLEGGVRPERVVRRPAMVAEEDTHVRDEVRFEEDDGPARSGGLWAAGVDEHAQCQDQRQRHKVVVE